MNTGEGRDSDRKPVLNAEEKARLAAELAGDTKSEEKSAKRPEKPVNAKTSNAGLEDGEREFTLSTASLFGLFLALVILCGIFFGFGFTMGRRSSSASNATESSQNRAQTAPPMPLTNPNYTDSGSQAALAAPDDTGNQPGQASAPDNGGANGSATGSAASTANPSAGNQNASGLAASDQTASDQSGLKQNDLNEAPPKPTISLPVAETPLERRMEGPAQRAARQRIRRVSTPAARPAAAPAVQSRSASEPTAAPAPLQQAATGQFMVQVAAVARSQDANLLASALRQQGYAATVRNASYDKLLHVQVGPFSTRQQAEIMRHKLIAHGYNAIIK